MKKFTVKPGFQFRIIGLLLIIYAPILSADPEFDGDIFSSALLTISGIILAILGLFLKWRAENMKETISKEISNPAFMLFIMAMSSVFFIILFNVFNL